MSSIEDASRRVGGTSADLARRAATGVTDTAKRIGPKRGILGLVIAGVAIGGTIFLVRYLRSRKGTSVEDLRDAVADDTAEAGAVPNGVTKQQRKRKHKHANV